MYTLFNTDSHIVATPQNSAYVYEILPTSAGVATISSDDSLRLLDPTRLEDAPRYLVKGVNRDVTSLRVLSDVGIVATGGRDGRVVVTDLRSGAKAGEVVSEKTGTPAPILSLACSSPYGLAAGTELTNHQASVLLWDTRSLVEPVIHYIESHSDDVTELQFHPTRPQILLSGSTDGLVNIYNTTITDEEEALHQTINHGSSISHANFLSETDIFALSHDEKFSMYELVTNPEEGVEEPAPVHYGDLREGLGGEYISNVVTRPDGGAVLGIGAHRQDIRFRDAFDLVQFTKTDRWIFVPESKVTLFGAHGSELIRAFYFLDTLTKAVFLQFLLPFVNAELADNLDATNSVDESPQPSLTAQSPIPQKPIHRNVTNGFIAEELVDRALATLQRYERQNPRPSRKPGGIIGTASQYALALLPKLSSQGPTTKPENKGLPKALTEAVGLLEEAERLDNADAIHILAQMNFYGNFSYPRNFENAFSRYSTLASMGNSSAQHMIGFMYATAIGQTEMDQAKALLYYTFAAHAGNTRSEMALAYRYYTGIGTVRSCEVAVKHYKNVADKAIDWYRSGPPGGMAWVQESYRLADDDGGVYGEGASYSSAGQHANRGGPNSDAHAALDDVLEYLDLMSRKGDFSATLSLGRLYYRGQKGLPRSLKDAKRYFMKVAKLYWQRDGKVIESAREQKPKLERDATEAAGYLGKMFLRGEGVEQSYDKAKIWFKRGMSANDAGSQYNMALMCRDGLGVPKNSVMAQQLFQASAKQDYAPAQVALGAMYLDQGSPNDITVANKYFEFASRYGHIEGLYYLAELSNHGVGRERSCGSAAAFYKNVAEKADPLISSFTEANEAMGEGNTELALIDYLLAAEQGYEKAQANVAYLLDQEKSRWSVPSWLVIINSIRPKLLNNSALALIHWTRSAKQSNIDSMVKMGDYYLSGIGTSADTEKAAQCYTAASEFHQSAQALYNLGWMHENGVGLDQDFHLAKRYYDHALETNGEAYLPVTLSLLKLRLRSAWNTLTHGRINSIQDEPTPQKQWSLSEWINNFLQEDPSYLGEYDDEYLPEGDPMPGGDADGMYDDVIFEGLGILDYLLAMSFIFALIALIFHRRRVAGEVERQRQEGQQGGQQQPPLQQDDRGVFPGVGDPEFNQWVAGGVGH
ncbi:hypothetical protein BJ878DRAFT_464063 [Calycina marina]|uniref:Uncharacterized protein n=1 Tax=Calycina marina TaxID=1763456 RepID=A0A9P7YZ13_9HELO|nr:hypothetical protein BJ878DRAFT_464063 [Calycina marina]